MAPGSAASAMGIVCWSWSNSVGVMCPHRLPVGSANTSLGALSKTYMNRIRGLDNCQRVKLDFTRMKVIGDYIFVDELLSVVIVAHC